MVYVRIKAIDGIEHEHQILNDDKNISISYSLGKFESLSDIRQEYEDRISDIQDNIRDEVSSIEDEAIGDYFDGRDLYDVYMDRYTSEDAIALVRQIYRKKSNKEFIAFINSLVKENI